MPLVFTTFSSDPTGESRMPASTDEAYLNALLHVIRHPSPEEAILALRDQFPTLDLQMIAADVRWGRDLRQRGYSRQEILEDIHLS